MRKSTCSISCQPHRAKATAIATKAAKVDPLCIDTPSDLGVVVANVVELAVAFVRTFEVVIAVPLA